MNERGAHHMPQPSSLREIYSIRRRKVLMLMRGWGAVELVDKQLKYALLYSNLSQPSCTMVAVWLKDSVRRNPSIDYPIPNTSNHTDHQSVLLR